MKTHPTYMVTFLDKDGSWADRDEDFQSLGKAQAHAAEGVMKNHHSAVIHKVTKVDGFVRTVQSNGK